MTALVFALAVAHVAVVVLAYIVGAKIGGWWQGARHRPGTIRSQKGHRSPHPPRRSLALPPFLPERQRRYRVQGSRYATIPCGGGGRMMDALECPACHGGCL